jgi:hypothetical protein
MAMTRIDYPEAFKPLASLLTESVMTTVKALTRTGHQLVIIMGAERTMVQDLSLGLVRELYPNLATTGVWFITDHPDEIPVGPETTAEANDDWYFGGGRGVFNPQVLPPAPEPNTEPLPRLLLEAGRRDLDALCILSPLTTTMAWDRTLNLYLTGTTVVIGIKRAAGTVVTIPHTDPESLLPLLFTDKIHPLLLDADTGTVIEAVDAAFTLAK